LDRQGPRTAVIVAVTVLGLVGVGVLVALAVVAGQVDGLLVALLLAAVPVPFLVAAYMWLDRYEPEPSRLVAAALVWGAVVSTGAAGLVQWGVASWTGFSFTTVAVVVAPVTEELTKGLLCVVVLVSRRRVAGMLDGIIYAGLVGVGFAFTENILYYFGAYAGTLVPDFSGPTAATSVFAVRGLASPFAHSLFTTAIGIAVVVAVTTRRRWLRRLAPILGYACAVGLHALWNGSTLVFNGGGFPLVYVGFMVPLFGFTIWVATRALNREAEVVRSSLNDAARRGWIHPREVHWLVRYGDRGAARRFARIVAGREAAKALNAYQHAATEMALMHDRVIRGCAPDDGVRRVFAHLRRMRSWRPYVVMPPLSSLPPQVLTAKAPQQPAATLPATRGDGVMVRREPSPAPSD